MWPIREEKTTIARGGTEPSDDQAVAGSSSSQWACKSIIFTDALTKSSQGNILQKKFKKGVSAKKVSAGLSIARMSSGPCYFVGWTKIICTRSLRGSGLLGKTKGPREMELNESRNGPDGKLEFGLTHKRKPHKV